MLELGVRASGIGALCLVGIAACGPSAEEQQACQAAKAAAAQAFDSYAARLASEADERNELRTRSEQLLTMAEEMGREQARGSGAGTAELLERTRATRAHHDAQGELAEAMTKAAEVSRRVAQSFRNGRVRAAMAVQGEAVEPFRAIERANDRVRAAAQTAGIQPRNRFGIEPPTTRSEDVSAEGLRLEIWRAAITSAQTAGQPQDESGDDLELGRLELDASARASAARTTCREVETEK